MDHSISSHTSAQIAILRPICIVFMLYVHVNPGFDHASHTGAMLYFGTIVVDIFGRTSVAALSLVSGFLLAYGSTRKDAGTLVWSRVRTLYLPMLVWSIIFVTVALGGSLVLGHSTGASRVIEDLPLRRLILESLMFLHGQPASQALGFLRDLTVSSILLILFLRFFGRTTLWFVLAALLAIVLFGSLEPLLYRPTILLFMLVGAAFYMGPANLNVPMPFVIIAILLFISLVIYELVGVSGGNASQPLGVSANVFNICKRAVLTILALALSSLLVHTQAGDWLRRFNNGVFLSYLCHTTLISILWAIWKHEIGGETHWAYFIFFTMSPIFIMVMAIRADTLFDKLPRPMQIGLRGKVRGATDGG